MRICRVYAIFFIIKRIYIFLCFWCMLFEQRKKSIHFNTIPHPLYHTIQLSIINQSSSSHSSPSHPLFSLSPFYLQYFYSKIIKVLFLNVNLILTFPINTISPLQLPILFYFLPFSIPLSFPTLLPIQLCLHFALNFWSWINAFWIGRVGVWMVGIG